jgi:hypothetical protein
VPTPRPRTLPTRGAEPVLTTIRPHAIEQRFVVEQRCAVEIVSWLRARFVPDPHGAGLHGDAYTVTTQYFDTLSWDVFRRRGSHRRAKYRIRRYNDETIVYFERKLRTRCVLAKRRGAVPVDTAPPLGDAPNWFSKRIELRGLRPVCLVTYLRVARHYGLDDGVARVTIDSDLRAGLRGDIDSRLGAPLLLNQSVVEIKCGSTPPSVVKELIERFALIPAPRSSKYRRAVGALGLTESEE